MAPRKKAASAATADAHWNDDREGHMTLVVSGRAGSGKTDLLRTITDALDGDTLSKLQLIETLEPVAPPGVVRRGKPFFRGFAIGDEVTIKSGGINMTLIHWCSGQAVCAWAQEGRLETIHLPVAALRLFGDPDFDTQIPF